MKPFFKFHFWSFIWRYIISTAGSSSQYLHQLARVGDGPLNER
jgi:hypothetical protein